MAVSAEFVAYIVELLAPLGRVASRRMFGGVGLYADDLFFAILAGDTLYLKVDDDNRGAYEAAGCKPFAPFPGRANAVLSYYNAPPDLLEDGEDLCRWARKSLAAALRATNAIPRQSSSKPKTKAKTRRRGTSK